ncbi:MAG: hypothetical protein KAS97_00875, partial [Candidatus Aminicenantes bacterium]|nr:hypothetical protein [Candidatus Aminicenantes bacterium]
MNHLSRLKGKLKISPVNISLILFFLFVFINWLYLSGISPLAPPDYYYYYSVSENIFSLGPDISWVPPFFPFLLSVFGNFLSVFVEKTDFFIIAGKLISFLASSGIVYFVYKLFKKIIGEFSGPATLLLVISPFYLKYISLPITDILFLFLIISTFYFLFEGNQNFSLFLSTLALLTRYEAIILVIPVILHAYRAKIKTLKVIIVLTFIILSSITAYLLFSERITNKIIFIFSNGSFLYFISNPVKLASLFYVNILFFIPGDIPVVIKIFLFLMIFGFFVYGYIILFKKNKEFTLGLLFFQVVFIISKGYISGIGQVFNAVSQTRRMLPIVFIFWFVLIAGVFSFFKGIKYRFPVKLNLAVKLFILSFVLIIGFVNLQEIKKIPIFLVLPFIFLVFITLYISGFQQKRRAVEFIVLALLFITIYSKSLNDSYNYIVSVPNKGAYMIAKWTNANLDE